MKKDYMKTVEDFLKHAKTRDEKIAYLRGALGVSNGRKENTAYLREKLKEVRSGKL